MNVTQKGVAGLPIKELRPCCAYRQLNSTARSGLWNQAARPLLALAALWLTACTSAYQGIYPDDSAFVSGDFIIYPNNSECFAEDDWQCELYLEEDTHGFLRNYRVESEFGVFSAEGAAMLDYRLDEIDAIASLNEFSTLDIFLDTFTDRALSPVRKVSRLATRPVDTVKRLPGGYMRGFQQPIYEVLDDVEDVLDDIEDVQDKYGKVRKISNKLSRRVAEKMQEPSDKSADDKVEQQEPVNGQAEKLKQAEPKPEKPSKENRLYAKAEEEAREEVLDYLDLTDREKRWMREAGIDRESRNPVLFDEIRRVAMTERIASYGTTFVTFPVMPGAAWGADMMTMAWSEPEHDIAEYLETGSAYLNFGQDSKEIAQASAPVSVNYAKKLKKNKAYPRSVRGRMANSLLRFSDMPGIDDVFAAARDVDSEGAARFFTASMEMAVWYQERYQSVQALVPVGPAVMVQLSDRRKALLLPGDAADWTPKFASAADALATGRPELWFREEVPIEHAVQLAYGGWYARGDWRGVIEGATPAEVESTFMQDFVDLLSKTNRP